MPAVRSRRALLPALVALLMVSLTAVALAKPSAGRFTGASGAKFSFSITRSTCSGAPKNLNNPNARAGAKKAGLCFSAGDGPKIDPTCEGDGSITGAEAAVAPMTGLRLSPSGKLHVKAYEYGGGDDPVGWTELSLTVSGTKASGFVRSTSTIFSADGTALRCDTGKLPFTAKRRG